MTREAAKEYLSEIVKYGRYPENGCNISLKTAEALYAATKALSVPERKKGEWVEREVKSREGTYLECSRCGCLPPTLECADRIIFMRSNFCPYCGANMKEDEE